MGNNFENFRATKEMQDREMREGLYEYEEEKLGFNEEKVESNQHKVEDFFKLLKKTKAGDLGSFLEERIKKSGKAVRNEIFEKWLKKDPDQAMENIGKFHGLNEKFQEAVGQYFERKGVDGRRVKEFFVVFGKIVDKKLASLIVQSDDVEFITLLENREKLPTIEDQEILGRMKNTSLENWSHIVQYADKFNPSYKDKIIKEVVKRRMPRTDLLVMHKDKLGASTREIVDVLYEKDILTLLKTAQLIESEYHQEIIDKALEKGKAEQLLEHLHNFEGIDYAAVLDRISEAINYNEVIKKFSKNMKLVRFFPEKIIENIAVFYPRTLIRHLYEIRDRVDLQRLYVTILKKIVSFDELNYDEDLEGLKKDDKLARALLEVGGGEWLAENLGKFTNINEDVFEEVVEGLLEGRNYQILIDNSDKLKIQKNDAFAQRIIESGGVQILLRKLDEFEGVSERTLERILEEAFKKGHFTDLIRHAENLGIERNDAFAQRIIESGGGGTVVHAAEKFTSLSRNTYQRIIEIKPGSIPNKLQYFKGVTREDLYQLMKKREVSDNEGIRNILDKKSDMFDEGIVDFLLENNRGKAVCLHANHELIRSFFEEIERNVGEDIYQKKQEEILEIVKTGNRVYLKEEDFKEYENPEKKLTALALEELNLIVQKKNISEVSLKDNESAKEVFETLEGKAEDWQDPELNKRFVSGAEIFGYDKMFAFAKKGQRHNALYAFHRTIDLYNQSGLSENEFYHNILQQVAMDTGTYGQENNTSYQMLNIITEDIGTKEDIQRVLEEAQEMQGIPRINALMQELTSVEQVFGGFRMLLQYKEVKMFVQDKVLAAELAEDTNEKRKDYVSALLFHPTITNKEAVRDFWKNPRKFFGLGSSHTSREFHDSKKPTNYLEIPQLDLEATDLRDSIIEGSLDTLQAFEPMEIIYQIPTDPIKWQEYQKFSKSPLNETIHKAFSNQSEATKSSIEKILHSDTKQAQRAYKAIHKGNKKPLEALTDDQREQIYNLLQTESNTNNKKQENSTEQEQNTSPENLLSLIKELQKEKTLQNPKKLSGGMKRILVEYIRNTQSEEVKDTEEGKQQRIQKSQELLNTLIQGEAVELPQEVQNEIKSLIYFGKFGYNEQIQTEEYRMKTNRKSDPDAMVAGSDTQCCMPFGDGKNNIYTANPICTLATLQRQQGDGKYRTVAQSVLTEDKDIHRNISEVRNDIENEGKRDITEILPQHILHQETSHIAADSVEVANNYANERYAQIIEDIYRDFFKEYTKRYAQRDNLNKQEILLGSCSYSLSGTDLKKNTFLPKAPVAYSDKTKKDVHTLNLQKEQSPFFVSKTLKEKEVQRKQEAKIQNPNLRYLTFRDALETMYIEGKVYNGTSIRQGSAAMENALIAKDISNVHKDRPNMSLKYLGKNNEMLGYMFAFETTKQEQGRYDYYDDEDDYYDEERNKKKTLEGSFIYVMDIAKLKEADNGIGLQMMQEFLRLYTNNYIKEGKLTPIYAEARETTSYKFITKYLNKMKDELGVEFEMEEIGEYGQGEDIMHKVIIRPVEEMKEVA